MPGSSRQPINAPAGSPQAAGVPWLGLGILAVLVLILAAFVAYFFFDVGKDEASGTAAPAPVAVDQENPPTTSDLVAGHNQGALGYPDAATRNTTRISGTDPVDISIAAALAAYPTTGPGSPPAAVTIVNADEWQSGVVAAALSSPPVGSPILLAPDGTLSEEGTDALEQLDPLGSPATDENKVFTVGKVAPPAGFEVKKIRGGDPATLAVNVAELKAELADGPPEALVVVSSDEPAYATPAATWAARSGDPVLFTGRNEVPSATIEFLEKKRNKDVPVFVLGPSKVVSSDALRQLNKAAASVERVGGEDPPSASVELARFYSGTFGWNLNDPGHGFTVARSDRPMDAIAATALSTGGTWPALLLTDSSDELPDVVEEYLLDVKPGYDTDPTRALYNHVWIIGDDSLIDVNQQASIDNAAELAPVETLDTP
ncbi:MAG: cell wall-binding repeat-containing protein [Solirubrobacterales bacterium]|nr:cell wall-binding repeat-containing protein [Solirubrobacterales bacterium]